MDSYDDTPWDFLDYSLITDTISNDLSWINDSVVGEIDVSRGNVACQQGKDCPKKDYSRKSVITIYVLVIFRVPNDSCSSMGTKACREKLRRKKLNDRFVDLSSTLEPERPAKADKLVILNDAIQVVKQLRTESQELKEENEKLRDEIKNLKGEKNELREAKIKLKSDYERMERQLKAMAMPPPGFMAAPPATYPAGPNKMPVYPGYSLIPMWQYLPPSTVDTSSDHELRPPAA